LGPTKDSVVAHNANTSSVASDDQRKTPEYYIGLMSGTSMDGIDAALLMFDDGLANDQLKLIATHSHVIPAALRASLIKLALPGQDGIDRLGNADAQLGELLADAAIALLAGTSIKPEQVTAIGSHGQTVRHRPPDDKSEHLPFSLQIGDPNRIAARTHITTVADFRRRDIALGGHGAPLVPAFHKALFQNSDHHRVIVNIGGISNITDLPVQGAVTGFDTGPGNGLLDAWIQRHLGLPYDDKGQWAASFAVHTPLLGRLKAHPFIELPPPKSTGREDFNIAWLDHELNQLDAIDPGAVQATLLAFTADTITEAITETTAQAIAKAPASAAEIYICGGGALNTALMNTLQRGLSPAKVSSTSELGLNPEWVEAAAFAWLARQTLLGLPGSLAKVTGASKSEVLGGIYPVVR